MWLCTLLIFPNRYRGFPPPPAFIVPGCLHDQHSDPVGNDTLVQESITSPQSLPMWTFVSWAILNVFRCFFFFFSFTWCESYLPAEIGLWKVVLIFIFSPPALPPDCFLWAQGPSQPFRPCEDAVPWSSGVTVVVTQSVRKVAALPTSNSFRGKLSPSGSAFQGCHWECPGPEKLLRASVFLELPSQPSQRKRGWRPVWKLRGGCDLA